MKASKSLREDKGIGQDSREYYRGLLTAAFEQCSYVIIHKHAHTHFEGMRVRDRKNKCNPKNKDVTCTCPFLSSSSSRACAP